MNVVCIGAGYVGSVTGTAFAALGHNTTIIDVDHTKIDLLNSGCSPIYEPGLDELISKYVGKNLVATSSYEEVKNADVIFIGVGTPSFEDGTADLTYVKEAAKNIAENLSADKFTVIVDKSTVPVGTADLVSSIIEEVSGLTTDEHFSVVSNPEFLREGFALEDVFFPDRIVIGASNDLAKVVMKQIYHALIHRENFEEISKDFYFHHDLSTRKPTYFETDTKSAEMIKYAANAFLAVKISYINEIARLCDVLGANVTDVAKGMGLDNRIGNKFLEASPGWSGSCFPKDTAEFLATSKKFGRELLLVRSAIESNEKMQHYIVETIESDLETLKGKVIGILGLTFKPNTDDARKTQATAIIRKLVELGAIVYAHDPKGIEMFKKINHDLPVHYVEYAQQVADDADALVLLTHWAEYFSLDWQEIHRRMKTPYIFDTRNYLPKEELRELGFNYKGVGYGREKAKMIANRRNWRSDELHHISL